MSKWSIHERTADSLIIRSENDNELWFKRDDSQKRINIFHHRINAKGERILASNWIDTDRIRGATPKETASIRESHMISRKLGDRVISVLGRVVVSDKLGGSMGHARLAGGWETGADELLCQMGLINRFCELSFPIDAELLRLHNEIAPETRNQKNNVCGILCSNTQLFQRNASAC